eukprot:1726319-Rhodomonas_salina.1
MAAETDEEMQERYRELLVALDESRPRPVSAVSDSPFRSPELRHSLDSSAFHANDSYDFLRSQSTGDFTSEQDGEPKKRRLRRSKSLPGPTSTMLIKQIPGKAMRVKREEGTLKRKVERDSRTQKMQLNSSRERGLVYHEERRKQRLESVLSTLSRSKLRQLATQHEEKKSKHKFSRSSSGVSSLSMSSDAIERLRPLLADQPAGKRAGVLENILQELIAQRRV